MPVKISDFELGWFVGLLEGEAHFRYANGTQIFMLGMTDYDTVSSVVRIIAKLTGKHLEIKSEVRDDDKRQELFLINISGEPARIIMRTVVPYMHDRRRAKIWQCLNKYAAPKQKTFKELGIDISQLVRTS